MTKDQNNLDPEEQSKDESSSDPETNDQPVDETVETPQKNKDALQVESIPEGSIIFRQSHLSWLIPSSIWVIGLVVVDIQFGLLGGAWYPFGPTNCSSKIFEVATNCLSFIR